MSQKVSNIAPIEAQVGAMLGSRIVLDPPKSEDKTETENDSEKARPKTTQQKTCLSKEREARSSVKTWEECRWEMRNVGYFKQAQGQAQASEQQRAHKQAQASTRTAQASTRK